MIEAEEIKQRMREAGFDDVGITSAEPLQVAESRFRAWLATDHHASLGYLERNIEKRFNPSLLVEGAKTVVVGLVNYKSLFSAGYPTAHRPKIASYALNTDYHDTIRGMLRQVLERLQQSHPTLTGRGFTDSPPLAEKSLAVRAGLGWIGRQSLLISPTYGSSILLGELLLSEPCDHYDSPFTESRCGSCRACIEACPARAIGEGQTIDARRCLARRTIEQGEAVKGELHGWIFGCEECQSCCPHNRHTPLATHPAFQPQINPLEFDLKRWQELSDEEFSTHFGHTPLTRAGLERLKENARLIELEFNE